MFRRIFTVLLYVLPVVFFFVCYFLIITSGEDIHQGANTPPDIIGDSVAAFNHSARFADMYAWSVINFFDYTFSFGIDTLFRILDVGLAVLLLYLTTFLALGHRPRFVLNDALVYAGVFLALMLTSNGVTLYGGFSKIHNYLLIGTVSLGFILIYAKDLLGQKLPEKWWFSLVMLLFGALFSLTSSVTAVAFLLGMVTYVMYLFIVKKGPPRAHFKSWSFSWRGFGIFGILVGLFLIYGVGPGLADYATSEVYLLDCDYVSFADIFENFGESVRRMLLHNLYNFGRFAVPFLVASVPVMIYILVLKRQKRFRWPKFEAEERNFLIFATAFVVMQILALSQIYYLTRMMLPVYLVAVAVYLFVAMRLLRSFWHRDLFAVLFVTLIFVIILIRTIFALRYLQKVVPILDRIKLSDAETYCVSPVEAKSFTLPYLYLGQEDFLVDWAMPETIYGKKVDFCE